MIDLVEMYVHWYAGRSQVQIAVSLGLDRKTVRKYLAPVVAAGLVPGGPPVMTEADFATVARSVPLLAVAVAIAGLGLSWAAVTSTEAATAALPEAQHDTAAAAVNTAAQVGTALGVAVLLTIASIIEGDTTSSGRGYTVAFLAAAILAGAVATALMLKPTQRRKS